MQSERISISRPQAEMIRSTAPTVIFLGGVGSGKTWGGAFWLVRWLMGQPDSSVCALAVSPVYHMLESTLIPAIERACETLGVKCQVRASRSSKEVLLGETRRKVFLRSADDPEKLSAVTVGAVWIDEAASTKPAVYKRCSQRMRDPNAVGKQMLLTTTPEGTRTWVQKLTRSKDTHTIMCGTFSNPWLTDDFRERLKEAYDGDPAGWRNYVEGVATDATGAIYQLGARNLRTFDMRDAVRGQIVLGWDFNVCNMHTAVAIYFEKERLIHFMGEVVSRDAGGVTTEEHAHKVLVYLDKLGLLQIQGNKVWDNRLRQVHAYIDASGANKRTNAATTDMAAVRNAGFVPRHEGANPLVRNRIASVNKALRAQRVLFDEARCPDTVRSIREHTRDRRGDPQKVYSAGEFQCDHACDCVGYVVYGIMPFRPESFGAVT